VESDLKGTWCVYERSQCEEEEMTEREDEEGGECDQYVSH
jgi:hypothetical protein